MECTIYIINEKIRLVLICQSTLSRQFAYQMAQCNCLTAVYQNITNKCNIEMSFQSKEVISYYNILSKNKYEIYKEIIRKHLSKFCIFSSSMVLYYFWYQLQLWENINQSLYCKVDISMQLLYKTWSHMFLLMPRMMWRRFAI